jgi:hypothetical protein
MSARDDHHPLLWIAPDQLRPTQETVGKSEVAIKRAVWRGLHKKKRKDMLTSHWFPGVLGPKGKVYIIDHHHLGLALFEEEVKEVPVMIQRDFSWLEPLVFWRTMEFNRWAHPYDAHGRRTEYDAIPHRLDQLVNDPYRSLAQRVRATGGCAKDATPYAEFLWADFFRERVKLPAGRIGPKSTEQALLLAHSHDAAYLPGWSGAIG